MPSGDSETCAGVLSPRRSGTIAASVAFVLGALYTAVSAYWGLGGTALLDTIGGALEREGRAGNATVHAAVWVSVVLKLAAALVGLMAVIRHQRVRPRERRMARRVAWVAATILVVYGGVLTVTGLLVQVGALHASAHADHRALRWHAFVWDPWFLVWGLVLATALTRSRDSQPVHTH